MGNDNIPKHSQTISGKLENLWQENSRFSRNDAYEQHGRSLGGVGLWREGIYLMVVRDFEAEGLLAMAKVPEVLHILFDQQGDIVDLRIGAGIAVLVENILPKD